MCFPKSRSASRCPQWTHAGGGEEIGHEVRRDVPDAGRTAEPGREADRRVGRIGRNLPHQSRDGLVSQSGVLQFGRLARHLGGRGRRRPHQPGPALPRPVYLARRAARHHYRADVRTRIHDIEVEDEAFALLEYPNGAHGYLYASTTEVPNHNMLEICGDKGKIVLHGSNLKRYG